MAKRSRRQQQARNKKWSRANTMNYIAGVILAVSMILGTVFVFGGAQPSQQAYQPTAPVVVTAAPPAAQAAATNTPAPTPTP